MDIDGKKAVNVILICSIIYGAYKLFFSKKKVGSEIQKYSINPKEFSPSTDAVKDTVINDSPIPEKGIKKVESNSADINEQKIVEEIVVKEPTLTDRAKEYLVGIGTDLSTLENAQDTILITMALHKGWDSTSNRI